MYSQDINTQLPELILSSGILEHFTITDFHQEASGQNVYTKKLTIQLEEKKVVPEEYVDYPFKASGFMPARLIKDCPIRRNLVTLSVKCRRWDVLIDGKYQKRSRNWKSVADGTRLGFFIRNWWTLVPIEPIRLYCRHFQGCGKLSYNHPDQGAYQQKTQESSRRNYPGPVSNNECNSKILL